MRYDNYTEYCTLYERLCNDAMEALYGAMTAELDDDATANSRHRTIRAALDHAARIIARVLADEERDNPIISPEDYEFANSTLPPFNYGASYFAELDRRNARVSA